MLALTVAGCGVTTVAVDDDPLTKRLGESGVTVQQIGGELTPGKLRAAVESADLTELNRSNNVVEHLMAYEPSEVDLDDLDAAIRNSDAPYEPAIATRKKWLGHADALAGALIPASAFRSSPGQVKEFVGHWNEYVNACRSQFSAMATFLGRGMAIKEPTLRFLKRSRKAIRNRDVGLYEASVEGYTGELKDTVEQLVDKDNMPKIAFADTEKAFDAVVEDANDSEAVRRLVETLRTDFPEGAFAKSLTR